MSYLGGVTKIVARLSRVPSQVASDAAEAIEQLVASEFDSGTDPYGQPWAPLATATLDAGRSPPPLDDTGSMRAGFACVPMSGAGISMTFDDAYAIDHQFGFTNARTGRDVPARPPLPDHGMPAAWEAALSAASESAFGNATGGGQ